MLAIPLVFLSCKQESKGSWYSVKDFRSSLQPSLRQAIDRGLVTSFDPAILATITDSELARLANAEHPILRVIAVKEQIERSGYLNLDLLTDHLDDTAWIAIDEGEFGLGFRMLADHLLGRESFHFKQEGDQEKLHDLLLANHDNLSHTYYILTGIKPEKKYYETIRKMAVRWRRALDGYEAGFEDTERAIYALARFEKASDIPVIKKRLLDNVWDLSLISFRLMTEFPDTNYFDILERYHRHVFYRFSGFRPHGFTGVPADRAAPEDFINALVAQKTQQSALLIDTLFSSLGDATCFPDRDAIVEYLRERIFETPCQAYKKFLLHAPPSKKRSVEVTLNVPSTMEE